MYGSTIQPSADDRATQFTGTPDRPTEHYSGLSLMVEAYAAIWLILMAWLFLIWRKTSNLTARVDGLEQAIARAEGGRDKDKKEPRA